MATSGKFDGAAAFEKLASENQWKYKYKEPDYGGFAFEGEFHSNLNPTGPSYANRLFYVFLFMGIIFRLAVTITEDEASMINGVLYDILETEISASGVVREFGEKPSFVEPTSDLKAVIRALFMIVKGCTPLDAFKSLTLSTSDNDMRYPLELAAEVLEQKVNHSVTNEIPSLARFLSVDKPDDREVADRFDLDLPVVSSARRAIREWHSDYGGTVLSPEAANIVKYCREQSDMSIFESALFEYSACEHCVKSVSTDGRMDPRGKHAPFEPGGILEMLDSLSSRLLSGECPVSGCSGTPLPWVGGFIPSLAEKAFSLAPDPYRDRRLQQVTIGLSKSGGLRYGIGERSKMFQGCDWSMERKVERVVFEPT